MKKYFLLCLLMSLWCILPPSAQADFARDVITTSAGDLSITFIGHGSLLLTFNGKSIQVDPYSEFADYSVFPPADLILITHHHQDHLDRVAMNKIRSESTKMIGTEECAKSVIGLKIMANGARMALLGITIEAVPAYNLVHKRDNGDFYHPRGEGNGYILTLGDKRLYIAGDTENTPEMKALTDIDYAFLPMYPPYTMTPEMVADAAMAFRPKVLYPYHSGESDVTELVRLLKDEKDIEVRIRAMK